MAAVKSYGHKKNITTSGKLIKAVYASYVYVYIFYANWSGRLEYNSLFIGPWGLGCKGQCAKNIAAIHPCHSSGNFRVTTPVFFSLRSRRKKNLAMSMDRLNKQNVAISCTFRLTSTAEVVSELCLFCRNS
jgi:hypothetical protein